MILLFAFFAMLMSPAHAEAERPVPVPVPVPDLNAYQVVLIACALAACIACIYMVFFFGRRLQTSAYLRESLVAAARQEELRVLLRELDDDAKSGPLNPNAPPPPGFGSPAQIWTDQYVPYSLRLADERAPEGETPQQAEKRRHDLAAYSKWEQEERDRYNSRREQAVLDAQQRAERRIPQSMDISLLGGGWTFLLEFSTVIVIIFTLMILGLGQIIAGKDISTILAAVAGYVLGKASAGTQKETESARRESEKPPQRGE